MSNKKGVQVIAPFVAPEGTPVAYASDIAGGHRVVATKTELTDIPVALLEVGMTVFVQDENKEYRLANKTETPVLSDWVSSAPSVADIKFNDEKSLADVLITKDEVATKVSDAVTAAGETYQTKEDALAAKQALEESIHAVSTAGLSEETKQDIQAAKDAAATINGFKQTLDETKAELTQKVEEAKQAALTTEDKQAIASIADVKATAEAAKAKGEELEPKITTNKEAIDELKTKVEALPDSDAVDAKISTAKESLNESIDLVKNSVGALKTVVQGDGETDTGLVGKIDKVKQEAADNLAAAKQALEHSIEQAATAGLPEETKQDIAAAKEAATKLTEITGKVDDAVTKATNADTKVGTLETKVTTLETFKTGAEEKLNGIDAIKETADTLKDTTVPAIDARVTALEGKEAPTDFTEGQKTKLNEILADKAYATSEDIENAKTALKADLVTSDAANELVNGAVTTAQGKITEAKEELEEKITKLGEKVDAIQVPDVSELATHENLIKVANGVFVEDIKTFSDGENKIIAIKFNSAIEHKNMPVTEKFYNIEGAQISETLDDEGYVRAKIGPSDPVDITNMTLTFESKDLGPLAKKLSYTEEDFAPIPAKPAPKYLLVAESKIMQTGGERDKIKAVELKDGINEYNFKVKLTSGTGVATNIWAMFASEDTLNDEEYKDLPVCLTINGQYGQFTTERNREIDVYAADNLVGGGTGYVKINDVRATFSGYKLKADLTPDGQNDTYIVTYHRPVNHG